MKLSYNWLNDYIDLEGFDLRDLSNLLTMKTCEVEGTEPLFPWLSQFSVVLVEETQQHPNADKLKICKVNTGKETIQIVTGASNVQAGKKYPLAPVGSVLPNGMELKVGNLRGYDSFGMLCSATELGLEGIAFIEGEDTSAGLLTLPDSFETGVDMRTAIGANDTILDIDNKSITHRADLWSHYGFARELSTLLGKPLKRNLQDFTFSVSNIPGNHPKASIQNGSARRYSFALFSQAMNTISPLFVQVRLMAVGMRPLGSIVDASNYTMLDMGQPNHAFDRSFIQGSVSVDFAEDSETMKTLDGKERILSTEIAVIRDGKKAVAIAGVMGGAGTEVSSTTTELFFESATFFRKDVRKAVAQLKLRSESSMRFEKGQDMLLTEPAIYRFAEILSISSPQLQMSSIETLDADKPARNTIETTFTYLRSRLGHLEMDNARLAEILGSLGLEIEHSGDNLTATIPTYRSVHDLSIPEDLVEELGRIIGYREIAPVPLMVPCEVPKAKNSLRDLENRLRDLMAESFHFSEVYNYDFHSEKDFIADNRFADKPLALLNPISADLPYMRVSPLPGMLHNVEANHKEHSDLRFFELERIFIPQGGKELPQEKKFLAAVAKAKKTAHEMLASLSSLLSHLLEKNGLPRERQIFLSGEGGVFHPGRSGLIAAEGNPDNPLVRYGQIHPKLGDMYDLPAEVFYFELFLEELLPFFENPLNRYIPVNRFPGSDFEITVMAPITTEFAQLYKLAGKATRGETAGSETYLETVEYLDTYEGEQIPAGQKAVSLGVAWRNRKRTLQSEEIRQLQNELVARFAEAGFPLRS